MVHSPQYKIIYILGAGHSGSTLLDIILGSSKQVFSLGEFSFYSIYLNKDKHKKLNLLIPNQCTCKKDLTDCPFWGGFSKPLKGTYPIIKNRSIPDTFKIIVTLILPFLLKQPIVAIGENEKVLKKAVTCARRFKPNVKYLVDSSKDPRRLYELLNDKQIPNENIFVIYLRRDGRAYVNSFKKNVRIKLGLKKRNIILSSIEWIVVNLASRRLIQQYNSNHIEIKYSDLSTNTQQTLKKLSSFLKIELETSMSELVEAVNKTQYHNIAGNIARIRKFEKITEDVSWKYQLSFLQKAVVSMIVTPFHWLWD